MLKEKILFTLFLSICFAEITAQQETKTEALMEENNAIIDETKAIEGFYELGENEKWREITQEILSSLDTPPLSKESIQTYHRRIFVFKYPSDNLWIKGFISFTPEPKHNPLLILYRWGNKKFALMSPGTILATYKNYTVVSSTLRGGISEGNDEFGGKDVDDMKNLIQYIPTIAKELGIHLTPSCVFMMGPSRGGMEMFLTLAHFPELQKHVNKIVALSAMLDMHQLIQDRPDDMKVMLEEQFGMPQGKNRDEWIAKRDPLKTVSAISSTLPILIVQGTDDNRIGLKEGNNMVNALKQTGHNVSYWEIKGGNHVLTNRPFLMNDIARWLESNTPCMSVPIQKPNKNDINDKRFL